MFTPEEKRAIEAFLGRRPNRVEEAVFSVLWSEHCSYKSSRPFLKNLPTSASWVVQGPGENAGIVRLKNGWCLAFKAESHNHPSAVEPVHGAATGVGGIIRDVLSVGARPVSLADSLRFGPLDQSKNKALFEGVVAGISFYGNSVGIPTVAGEVCFHESYSGNPLVNAMCVGLMREEDFVKAKLVGPGNPIILAGSTTGRDGIGGAAFASEDLVGETEEKRPAVQVGDPFMEKLLVEATLETLKTGAVLGMQDLGAGGLSGLGEMAHAGGVGAEIELGKVPLRVPDLESWEILISESQERMVLCVEKGRQQEVLDIYHKWGLNAVVIGEVISEPVFRARHNGQIVAEIPSEALGACPVRKLPTTEPARLALLKTGPVPEIKMSWKQALLKLLAHPDVADKSWVFRQYDHTVMTNTVLVPGAGDAAVMRVKGEAFGFAISIDGNGRYLHMDPREGAVRAVCEAARNLAAVGARPLGLTDCLNFASPEDPEVLWDFDAAVQGIAQASRALNIPVVSGNVSFYNQTETHKIHPTPVIGMVGIVERIRPGLGIRFKAPDTDVLFVGWTGGLEGSLLQEIAGQAKGSLLATDLEAEKRLLHAILKMHENDLLLSCHDVSDGGLLTAVAESCLAGNLGARLDLDPNDLETLFGEGPGGFVISCQQDETHKVMEIANRYNVPCKIMGKTVQRSLSIGHQEAIELDELLKAYSSIHKEMSR